MPTLSWEERVELAQCYAPRLILFPEKQNLGTPKIEGGAGDYQPRALELLLERGRLYPGTLRALTRWKIAWLFSQSNRILATLDNLAKNDQPFDQICLLGGPIPNRQQAWDSYFEILNSIDAQGRSGFERFPLTTYAHVITRAEAETACRASTLVKPKDFEEKVGRPFYQPDRNIPPDDVALQYWFCYYFNDWANVHEADWESITIFLRRRPAAWRALGATYSVHENGARRHWKDIERVEDTHPVVYVSSGSHASYFQYVSGGHATELAGTILGDMKFKIGFSTGNRDFVPPPSVKYPPRALQVEVLPDPIEVVSADNPARRHLKWMNFRGSWGVRELGRLIAGGPTGPAQKGLKWLNPFAWSEAECWPDYLIY